MASGSGSSLLHVSEPSSVNVASDGDSVPKVNEICDPKYPLWRHVNKIENNGPDGGNAVLDCKFCGKQISGSYTRTMVGPPWSKDPRIEIISTEVTWAAGIFFFV